MFFWSKQSSEITSVLISADRGTFSPQTPQLPLLYDIVHHRVLAWASQGYAAASFQLCPLRLFSLSCHSPQPLEMMHYPIPLCIKNLPFLGMPCWPPSPVMLKKTAIFHSFRHCKSNLVSHNFKLEWALKIIWTHLLTWIFTFLSHYSILI